MDIEIETNIVVDNFQDACRVCLAVDESNQLIFRDEEAESSEIEERLTLSEKIKLHGGIEIFQDDGLPTKICTICISKISVAHNFRQQCQTADKKLRKLYRKSTETRRFSGLKDQDSQTEATPLQTGVKKEETMMRITSAKTQQDTDTVDAIDDKGEIEVEEHKIFVDVNAAQNEMEKDKRVAKREAHRSRRVCMFKRVTSIENMKSYKEKQRRYIKKNVNSKIETNEQDSTISRRKNTRLRASRECNLSHKCNKCKRSYSTKKALERHSLTHRERKPKGTKKLDPPQPEAKPEPVSCKICDKNFRKTDTMVRHLNVHKKANPKDVFSILKEIRDRRKLENKEDQKVSKTEKKDVEANVKEEGSSGEDTEMNNYLPMSNEDRDYSPDTRNSESHSENEESFNNLAFYRCKHCTKCYSTKKSLQRHMLIHDEKKFVCNVCNMKFFRPDRLKSHRDRYGHDEDKECTEPQKPPDDKSAIKLINSWIREELDSDNEGKGFPCETCGKSYVTKKSLQKHKANVHEARQRDFCAICKAESCSCAVGESLTESEKKVEKSKPFSCDECNKTFEKESKLEKHLRIHERAKEQQDSNFKRFLCHICSKTFRQNTGLMFHMRTHTGYKPHVCKYCGRGFTSNSNCINHERTHTGDRPFVCHFCSAAFAKSCTLKAHITTHTGEANYHCKTCGKSFRRLKYLKEHRFTHTGEKPYACKICGTAYSHSGSLFVHEKKCKAQYSNYQTASVGQNMQNYNQSQTSINTSSVMTPMIPMLSSSHNFNNVNNPLASHTNKSYVDNMHRMGAHAAAAAAVGNPALHMHSNPDVSEMASAVRSFAIIGQIFHS